MQYQTRKKETENKLLKAQQLENEVTIKSQRMVGASILLLGILAMAGVWFAYCNKRSQNNLLENRVRERTKALEKSNEELERSNLELEKSNEELERFAYIASHDLKQPLNTVINFSGLLSRKLKNVLDNETQSYFNYIIKGGNQMKSLIEDILEYSKLGEEKREKQTINLNILVDQVKDSVAELIERKNAQIEVIGTLSMLKEVRVNMILLFKNLIENGIKYNQSKTPTITIQQRENGAFTRLSFSDNGIGIEEKYFPKLFKMFSRLQNRKDYEGTGLGLSLCKKIIQNMGGKISVESQINEGSTFHVDIPKDLFLEKSKMEQLITT